jgi:hypothetical protein
VAAQYEARGDVVDAEVGQVVIGQSRQGVSGEALGVFG